MKKIIYTLIALTLCVCLAACGSGNGESKGSQTVTISAVNDIEEYKVVRSDSASEAEKNIAVDLHQALFKVFKGIKISTDYNSAVKEILVGNTKRQESIDAKKNLRYYDYVIKKVGNKIVIAGGSDEALQSAVDIFKTNFIDSAKSTVKVPTGEGYKYTGNYTLDKLTVNGVDITEFKLYNNSLIEINSELHTKLRTTFGVGFETWNDEMLDDEHYIILDGTELIVDKYSITVEDGNIRIKGSAHSLETAIDNFLGEYIKGLGSKVYDLTSADNVEASTGKKEIYTKDQLLKVIDQIYNDPSKIAIGEEVQGGTDPDTIAKCIQKFFDATGEMPGIMGIDLACYGIDLTKTNDLKWSSFICDLVDYAAGGGMITASAHWENPSKTNPDRVRGNFGSTNTLEAYEKNFTDLITEGTEYNKFFKNELAINARFFQALEDNGVTIIWRPLHEANGGWFWFCTTQQEFTLESKYVIDIWHYIYEYFTEECGLTNLIWCYGPNYSPNINDNPGSTMSTTYLYPGDDYCDIVGVDWYSSGNLEITSGDNYLRLTDLSRKPGAITEFGPSGIILADTIEEQPQLYNSMDLYGNLYELTKEGYSFVYLLTWGGKWGIPAMGRGDELMQTDLCIGQAEIKAMLDALK